MDANTAAFLVDLNRKFYSDFGAAFAATRRRIQDGVRRLLGELPDDGAYLDVGCGSGALAVEWLKQARQSSYLGVDFSAELLDEARAAVAGQEQARFEQADLADPQWAAGLPGGYRGVLSFAVFHHLPGRELRLRILRQIHELLLPGGLFVHSQWQFQNSPKLMERRRPWETVGLTADALEPGDTLLDWRFALPGQAEREGLRYVHLFSLDELADLAQESGFRVRQTFESDGQGGRLSLYQVWEKSF